MFFLENRVGLFLYHLIPNHIVWNWLSDVEKKIVLKNNITKNNMKYEEAEKYSEKHNQIGNPLKTPLGKFYAGWIKKVDPSVVLEIGPGGGFYTQVLFETSEIDEYDEVDCVEKFLTITKTNILARYGNKVRVSAYHGDFLTISSELLDSRYDLILCSGCLHHFPNRIELANTFQRILKPGGIVLSNEMTHYAVRVRKLLKQYLKLLWCGTKWYAAPGKPCTHSGLTLQELNAMATGSGLRLEFVNWNTKFGEKTGFFRFISSRVGFVMRKI